MRSRRERCSGVEWASTSDLTLIRRRPSAYNGGLMVTKCGSAIIVCTIALSTTLVNPIAGQVEPLGEAVPSRLAVIVQNAKRVRVENPAGRIYVIRNVTVQGDHLRGVEENSGHLVDIQMRHVRRLWRRGSAAGTGFIIGGVAGTLAGAALGAVIAESFNFNSSSVDAAGAAVKGALFGGVTFGLVGMLIAAPFGKWKTAYKAPNHRVQPLVGSKTIGFRITF